MSAAPVHSRSFIPRYYEMDLHGFATPLTMLSLFEETAFSHAEETEWPVYRLRDEGFGWVLLHGGFSMERYPHYRESFTVETWLDAASRFYGRRRFAVRDGGGALLGSSSSVWVFYNLARREPAPVFDSILRDWGHDPDRPLSRSKPEIAVPAPSLIDPHRHYDVRRSDIDTNGHVNNVNYLEWALEAVPPRTREEFILSSVEGRYLHEVRYGERVRPASELTASSDWEQAYNLAVYSDGKPGQPQSPGSRLVSSARSVWKRRSWGGPQGRP